MTAISSWEELDPESCWRQVIVLVHAKVYTTIDHDL